MPQFDFYSFSSQTFWVLLGFIVFYFFVLYYYLVNLAFVFKFRKKLINKYYSINNSAKVVGLKPYDKIIGIIIKSL